MTHDPWTLHAALSCPSCHVVGQVVTNDSEVPGNDDGYEEPPYQCASCGQTWLDSGVIGDISLKEVRRHYMRRFEGMPYEAPKPPEPKKATPHPFDQMLADRWRKDIEERATRPALDLSKLKKAEGGRKWMGLGDLVDRARVLGESDDADTVVITPVMGAGQHLHNFACTRWQWPPGRCSCGAGDE